MKIDVLANEIKRIADALESIAKFQGLERNNGHEKFDFSSGSFFSWSTLNNSFRVIEHSFEDDLELLLGIDEAKIKLEDNTIRFAKGFRVNNALLWGARGMGKSSLVRATTSKLMRQFKDLKLVEVPRTSLNKLGDILGFMEDDRFRFVLFCDDLAFSQEEDSYHYLKSLLDGGVNRYENIVFYATSNRRHLISRKMDENEDIILSDEVNQKIALSDRFGLWLGFYDCDQDTYLKMVEMYLKRINFDFLDDNWKKKAIEWQIGRGSRSGRTAWQFICQYANNK